MRAALETLFYAADGDTGRSVNNKCVFINSMCHRGLTAHNKATFYMWQHFRPYVEDLERCGFSVHTSCDEMEKGAYDLALILVPKNMIEARYMIAQGIDALCEGGVLICAADNKAGGGRLKKLLQNFGFQDMDSISRNKAKAVRACKCGGINQNAVIKALAEGAAQPVLEGRFISQPGIFGWDKEDPGSKILVENLPSDIHGRVADFGCGYGYLSDHLLRHNKAIKTLYCIDADKRALDVCAQNVQKHFADSGEGKCQVEYRWLDLCNPSSILKDMDYIIMNPPFHEGKSTDVRLGVSFILRAYESLRKKGALWMVANNHLAYEIC